MSSRYARSRITRCSPLSRESLKHAKDAVKANKPAAAPTADDESVENENDSKQVIQDSKMARKKSGARATTRSSKRVRKETKPTVEDSTVKLLDLPTEMLALIADFLDGKDLLVLRLAHSLLAAAADDSFARIFFKNRKHLFTSYGLDVLTEISLRPNWARKMRSIEFCTVELDRQKYGTDKGAAPKHRTRGAERRENIHSKFDKETRADDEKHESLFTMLEMLETLPDPVEIGLIPGFNSNQLNGSFGLSELLSKLDTEVHESDLTAHDCNEAFVSLMMAMDEADYFPVDCNFFMSALKLSSFDSLARDAPTCPSVWSILVVLDLGLDHPRHLWHAPHTSALEAFFAEATGLTYLSMQFNNHTPVPSWPEANCINWLVAATSHMKLDHLSLMGASTKTADLIALATAHAAKLRFLALHAINVPNSECWSAVFSSLRGLGLAELVIDSLTTGFDGNWLLLVDGAGEDEIRASGEETVTKVLDELAKDPQYVDLG